MFALVPGASLSFLLPARFYAVDKSLDAAVMLLVSVMTFNSAIGEAYFGENEAVLTPPETVFFLLRKEWTP